MEVPTYDFSRHTRSEEARLTGPADVVVVEGILVLAMKEVREMCNMKIYVDTGEGIKMTWGREYSRVVGKEDSSGHLLKKPLFVQEGGRRKEGRGRVRARPVFVTRGRGDSSREAR